MAKIDIRPACCHTFPTFPANLSRIKLSPPSVCTESEGPRSLAAPLSMLLPSALRMRIRRRETSVHHVAMNRAKEKALGPNKFHAPKKNQLPAENVMCFSSVHCYVCRRLQRRPTAPSISSDLEIEALNFNAGLGLLLRTLDARKIRNPSSLGSRPLSPNQRVMR